jgi:DNA polymerase III sliding clamp (beta) subunit (PCNA family)
VKYVWNSVLVKSSAKNLTTVATNGKEIAICEKAVIGSDFQILVPREFVSNFANALSRAGASLSSNDKQIKVSHDSGTYFCKQIDGNFPNYKAAIPEKTRPLGVVKVEEIKSVVESCIGYSAHEEAPGVFKFSGTELMIEFLGDKNTKLDRHMPGKFDALTVLLSTKKIHNIFKNIKTDDARLFFVDELSPIKIESGDLLVLTMPMRAK